MKRLYIPVLLLMILSCSKEKEWYVNTHVYDATLKINTYLKSDSTSEKTPLQYVIISLYKTEYDRKMHKNAVATTQTDAIGFAILQHLTQDYYYGKAWHYIYGDQLVQVTTPDAQETHIEIDF